MRRATSTVAVIELPTIIPASGTTVRPSTGKTPRPNSTPSVTTEAAPNAASATGSTPGTSAARRRTVTAANATIPPTHSHDHTIGVSGSITSASADPMSTSWTSARTAAHAI